MHDYQKNGMIDIEYATKARKDIHRKGDQEGASEKLEWG